MPHHLVDPEEFRQGDTVRFEVSEPDYPVSQGWQLTYRYANASDNRSYDATATSDTDWLVRIAPADTQNFQIARYSWARIISDGTDVYTLNHGSVLVRPSLLTSADGRTHAEKVVDALEAVIEGRATSDQLSMSVGGMSISRMAPQEMVTWIAYYRAEIAKEHAHHAAEQGLALQNLRVARF